MTFGPQKSRNLRIHALYYLENQACSSYIVKIKTIQLLLSVCAVGQTLCVVMQGIFMLPLRQLAMRLSSPVPQQWTKKSEGAFFCLQIWPPLLANFLTLWGWEIFKWQLFWMKSIWSDNLWKGYAGQSSSTKMEKKMKKHYFACKYGRLCRPNLSPFGYGRVCKWYLFWMTIWMTNIRNDNLLSMGLGSLVPFTIGWNIFWKSILNSMNSCFLGAILWPFK